MKRPVKKVKVSGADFILLAGNVHLALAAIAGKVVGVLVVLQVMIFKIAMYTAPGVGIASLISKTAMEGQ